MAVRPTRQPMPRTRVLIVEDHPIVRAVVRMACEASPTLEVVGEADGRGAIEECELLHPDVVVLDPAVPGARALEIADRMRARGAHPRILVLTDPAHGPSTLSWMRSRVDGLLPKSSGVRTIARAIETIAEGKRVLAPEQQREAVHEMGRLVRTARLGAQAEDNPSLTPRELQVLRLLADGWTIRQTASRTGISPRTVESHVTKLYRKLGVHTRMQAIARAASLGFISIGIPGHSEGASHADGVGL
jgi:two-component system, NarL family, response regulator YdfI